ncbi:restriction endonuclease subunit S [Thomasclavelia sp.]|uniref:restriction endonuclease subunit S n=1 Tax=Thomasclavelia sp. TaxID=3025757 RepID=UPI0025DD6DB8|nr:restriction endonuclease subunit S [Thomasclavelia sp.]
MLEYSLEDVCLKITDGAHFSPKGVKNGYPMLSVKDMREYGFSYENCKYIEQCDYDKLVKQDCIPHKGDVLVAKDGSYLKHIFVCEEQKNEGVLSSIAIFRPNKEFISSEYLMYLLKSPSVFNDVKNNYVSGSALPRIVLKDFKKVKFRVHDRYIQNKIVDILSRLDEKIKLNNMINNNLEQQAQALYRKMFIENANPEWSEGTISDLGIVVGGSTPSKAKPEYYTQHGIAWITPKDLSLNKSKFITRGENDISELGLRNSSATIMPKGTVLFSSRAPIGYIAIAAGDVTTNQGFKSIVPKSEIGTAFIYYFLKNALPTIERMASGSTFKEISGSTMKSVPAFIPNNEALAKFNEFCTPIFEQQQLLESQNQHLSQMRDTLLPKLISGELDVSDIEL